MFRRIEIRGLVMTSTNLHLLKTCDGKPVNKDQIRVGMKVTFPSGAGGVLNACCRHFCSESALFVSLVKDWPARLEVRFNQEDLTDDEFIQLLEDIKLAESYKLNNRALLHRGAELGYVKLFSYTQLHLTEKAYERIHEIQDK